AARRLSCHVRPGPLGPMHMRIQKTATGSDGRDGGCEAAGVRKRCVTVSGTDRGGYPAIFDNRPCVSRKGPRSSGSGVMCGLKLSYDHVTVKRWLAGSVCQNPDVVAAVLSDAWGVRSRCRWYGRSCATGKNRCQRTFSRGWLRVPSKTYRPERGRGP